MPPLLYLWRALKCTTIQKSFLYSKIILGAALAGLGIAPLSAMAQSCMPVSGTIAATVVGGDPVTVLGTVDGDLAGATMAIVSSQAEGDEGRILLGLGHAFVTFDRGTLQTKDSATWTPIPGFAGLFHMSTSYEITGGSGSFAGATGHLINDGVADTNTGQVTLRYEGEVCLPLPVLAASPRSSS